MKTDDFLGDYERELRAAVIRGRHRSGVLRRTLPRVQTGAILVPATLAAVAGVVSLGLLAGEQPTAPQRHEERPAVSQPSADAPPFSVLTAGGADTGLSPSQLGELRDDPAVRRLEVAWERGRLATRQHGYSVVAVPAEERICLLAVSQRTGSDLTCKALATAAEEGMSVRVGEDDTASTIIGLVPDGASRVAIHEAGSPVGDATVENNAFVMPVGHGPATASWTDAAGTHDVPVAPSPRFRPR